MLKTKILRDLGVASMLCLVVGCSEDLAKCSGVDGDLASFDSMKNPDAWSEVGSWRRKSIDISDCGVTLPVTSLCGYPLGKVPPYEKYNRFSINQLGYQWMEMDKPFRGLDSVHLQLGHELAIYRVDVFGKVTDANYSDEEISEEISTIVAMLESKYGIKMTECTPKYYKKDNPRYVKYEWACHNPLPDGFYERICKSYGHNVVADSLVKQGVETLVFEYFDGELRIRLESEYLRLYQQFKKSDRDNPKIEFGDKNNGRDIL